MSFFNYHFFKFVKNVNVNNFFNGGEIIEFVIYPNKNILFSFSRIYIYISCFGKGKLSIYLSQELYLH